MGFGEFRLYGMWAKMGAHMKSRDHVEALLDGAVTTFAKQVFACAVSAVVKT